MGKDTIKEIKLVGNKEEIIEKTMSRFYPMSEEEQKILTYVLICSYIECLEGMENTTGKTKEHWYYQKETYDFILRLFTKPAKELTEIGVLSPREFTFRQAQKEIDELNRKVGKA